MQDSTINLKLYVSVLAFLGFQSAKVVKQCAQNPNLKKYDKGINDPVTEADYKVQSFLIKGLRHFFPKLRIVGEETTEYKGQINLNFEKIPLDSYPSESHLDEQVPIEELCVWIDPIDNTKGFIQGTLQGVAVLIGLSRNKKAYLGLVVTPYQVVNNKTIYHPRVNIGHATQKEAFISYQLGKWVQQKRPELGKPLRIVTSDKKANVLVTDIATKYEAKLTKTGGSGYKMNLVIFGEADALIYIGQGNCRWDSCANQAIIWALGGIFSDTKGNQIDYDPDKNFLNSNGNVCLFDQELHKNIIKDLAILSEGGKL